MNTQHHIIMHSLLAVFLIAGLSAFTNDSESSELSDFLFVVNTTNDQILLNCKKGCAWTELSFSAKTNGNYQAVDQFGMTTTETSKIVEDSSDLSEFLFKIQKTNNGISLLGLEGSAWTELSFSCYAYNCGQAVDQYGMTNIDSN
ncbi:hypothetical protein DYD21_20690 [Rhodohalobacter sp. SW132]|nr:hypothetical protein DYD21_20690 [Rhodohalobacter sp. SW132]